eukprot:CAMPEP_0183531176 /NCGR_PEP_ID=MMETSP0371-20130417/24640_1 /TAXON_ID=268820 /ORGANISM="Peridinium aciculiferum, Strain PAER-2" /LENGTH=117 /DNA_ID=CAMNT_0025731157 /DNA_START=1 /DNA_END=351 /DNA_ORIENTATION=-
MHHYGEFVGREGHVLRGDNGRIIVSFQDDNMWFGKLREVSLPHRVLMTVMDSDAETERLMNIQSDFWTVQHAKGVQRYTGSVGTLDVTPGKCMGQEQMAQFQLAEEFEGTRKGYVFT